MNWNAILKTGYIKIGDLKHDVSHLQDTSFPITISQSKGHSELNIELLVKYSSHCISEGEGDGECIDFSLIGEEYKIIDDGRKERKFCVERYTLSKELPSIFSQIATKKCFFANNTNFIIIESINELGKNANYCIYFNARRISSYLEIYVASAYINKLDFKKITGHRPIAAKVLLAKKFKKEKIKRIPLG